MRFLFVIFLFLSAVAGSAFYAKFGLRASVEQELQLRCEEILKHEGFPGVKVTFDHISPELSGTVDNPADLPVVAALLREKVPGARWPEGVEEELEIRPTLPPRLRIHRADASAEVLLEGTLSSGDVAAREMLGARLQGITGVGQVENAIDLDPMVLPFRGMAEFASLASGLMAHEGSVELTFAEDVLRPVGEVPNEGVKENLLDLAARVKAGKVDDAIRVKPVVIFTREAELKVTRNRFGVTLTGILGDETERATALESLRANTKGSLADRIEISAQCGPAGWIEDFRDLVPALLAGTAGEMTVEFGTERVRLSGNASTAEARAGLLARLALLEQREVPWSVETNLLLATEPAPVAPVRLSAELNEDLLVLSGEVPQTEWVVELEARIADRLPELSIKNDLKTAGNVEGQAWTRGLADFFVEALPRLKGAKIRLEGGELHLEGRTVELPDRQILQNLAVNLLPPTYKVQNRLLHADQPFPKPALLPEQRTRLTETLKSLPVYFEKNSAALGAEEKKKVAAIFAALKESGAEVTLEVTGFADNIGNADQNRELSLRRAESVRAELQGLGIPAANLVVGSKGEDVSGLSRSELWKARRVEVSLQPLPTENRPPA